MRPIRILLHASLDGGVGKTTLSAVLSVAKGYTLLVDMDWEKAELSQLFRAPKKPGWLAPYLDAGLPYVHRVNPMLYIIPGYEAADMYMRHGEDFAKEAEEVVMDFIEHLPLLIQRLRIPVDTVIIDTTAALRLDLLAKLQKMGVYNVFIADRRFISRISDIKAEQYRRYMAYSSLVVVNQLERDEIKIARKVTPVTIKRVAIKDYYGESIANAVLRDRENRKSIDHILTRIKSV
ncbi:ParA family protein [Pyrobaculum aerophilum]|uniref:ATPase n=1 Tax=Pyrobaculum aerophilum TaxID=13773 RepID=A0A371QZD2_9CREN|nr:ParA family protein [Pyrobaculum aerophilum]RFA96181.1 ATPase [Pyrobaculum aerophilum]RFA98588.1 ATPase [Pyrobaculum aerophilum]